MAIPSNFDWRNYLGNYSYLQNTAKRNASSQTAKGYEDFAKSHYLNFGANQGLVYDRLLDGMSQFGGFSSPVTTAPLTQTYTLDEARAKNTALVQEQAAKSATPTGLYATTDTGAGWNSSTNQPRYLIQHNGQYYYSDTPTYQPVSAAKSYSYSANASDPIQAAVSQLGYKYAAPDYGKTLLGLNAQIDTTDSLYSDKYKGLLFGNPSSSVLAENPFDKTAKSISSPDYANVGPGTVWDSLAAPANSWEWSGQGQNQEMPLLDRYTTWLYEPDNAGNLNRAGYFLPTSMLNPYQWKNGGADEITAKVSKTPYGSLEDLYAALDEAGIKATVGGAGGYIIPKENMTKLRIGEGINPGETFLVDTNRIHRDTDKGAGLGALGTAVGLASLLVPGLAPVAAGLSIGNGVVNNDPLSIALGIAGASGLTSQLTDGLLGNGGSLSDAANQFAFSDGASLGTATPNLDIGGSGLLNSAALTYDQVSAMNPGQVANDVIRAPGEYKGSGPLLVDGAPASSPIMDVPDISTVDLLGSQASAVVPEGLLSPVVLGGGAAALAAAASGGSSAAQNVGQGLQSVKNPTFDRFVDNPNLDSMGGGQGMTPGQVAQAPGQAMIKETINAPLSAPSLFSDAEVAALTAGKASSDVMQRFVDAFKKDPASMLKLVGAGAGLLGVADKALNKEESKPYKPRAIDKNKSGKWGKKTDLADIDEQDFFSIAGVSGLEERKKRFNKATAADRVAALRKGR